ncbi:MAG TPA: hypothetical protein VK658_24810 [Chryseolinea sp.]|nr:hypothetical protein [Chryseolinea sp.]
MPELSFYLDTEDKINLVSFVFAQNGYLIPALQYSEPKHSIVDSTDKYLSFVDQSVLFFIVHESFFDEPLTWSSFTKGGRELFYMPQRIGGPTIDFLSPGAIHADGMRVVGQGSISYYPTFMSSETAQNVRAPKAQDTFYKKLMSLVKDGGISLKLSKRIFWIGNKTLAQVRNGTKLMNVSDETLKTILVPGD